MLRPFYVLFHLIHLSLLLLLRACDGADSPALLASSKSSCAKATKDSDSASRAARAISTSPATMAFTSQRSWTAGRPKLTGGSPSVINLFWSGTCRYVPSPHLEIENEWIPKHVVVVILVDDGEKSGERVSRGGRLGAQVHVRPRRIGRGQNGRASSADARRTAATADASPLSVGRQSDNPPLAPASVSQSGTW